MDFQTWDQKIHPYHIWHLEKIKRARTGKRNAR